MIEPGQPGKVIAFGCLVSAVANVVAKLALGTDMPTGILHIGLQNPEKAILEKLLYVDFIDFIRNPNQRFAEGLGNRICGSLGLI